MSDPKFYDVGVILANNSKVKDSLGDAIIDLQNIEESIANQDITGNQIMSAISMVEQNIKDAILELIVEDDLE